MKNHILGRFPLVRGTIILLALFSISPIFVAGLISLQEEKTENQIAKVSNFATALHDSSINAFDLRIGGGVLRPVSVDPALISWNEGANNIQPPPDCFLQYGDSENAQRFEICVAYPKVEAVEHLYVYLDYCAVTDAGTEDLFELTLSTYEEETTWWLPVRTDQTPTALLGSQSGQADPRIASSSWDPVATSQRCPGSISKQLLRLRVEVCPELNSVGQCADYVTRAQPNEWLEQLAVDVTRHAVQSGSTMTNTVSSVGVRGIRRGATENALSNLVDEGEVIYFGRCNSADSCECFQGFTSYIDSEDIAPQTGALHSLVGGVFPEDFSNYCATSVDDEWLQRIFDDPSGDQAVWLNYERSPNLNLSSSEDNLTSMLPLMGYSALALLFSAFFVYMFLGRPLERLTLGLIKSGDLDSNSPIDIPYVETRNEIGTVARAFRTNLERIQSQLKRERRLSDELKIKLERDRDINSIIAHEIKSPFHNLKNKYPENLDIERIDTALQAILRLDQAVQSSSDEVTVVNIAQYLRDYIQNKEDVPNIVLVNHVDLNVELRGLLLWLVLDNITANADRFRSSRAVPIEFKLLETSAGCALHITNDGPTIPEDKMDSIFNLRYTDNRSARKNWSETNQGIGLFVSRYYMRMLGGDLALIPNPSGVTFAITLKRAG